MSTPPITKLFVSQLPYSTDENQLRDFFAQSGWNVVDVRVIFDRATGLSKGFGFVELDTPENAVRARDQMNGATLKDRRLIVDLARPAAGGGGPGPRPGPRPGDAGAAPYGRREFESRRPGPGGPGGGYDRGGPGGPGGGYDRGGPGGPGGGYDRGGPGGPGGGYGGPPRTGGYDRGGPGGGGGYGGPPRTGGYDRGGPGGGGYGGPPRTGGFDRGGPGGPAGPGGGGYGGPPRGFTGPPPPGAAEEGSFGTKNEFGDRRRSFEPRKKKPTDYGRGDEFGAKGGRRSRPEDFEVDPDAYDDVEDEG